MTETLKAVAAKTNAIAKTLDAISTSVDKRFERLDKRFEQIDKRFEQVDKRFEQIDKRFEQVDQRFEQIDRRFDEMQAHLSVKIEAIGSQLQLVLERLDAALGREPAHAVTHARLYARLDDHELRLLGVARSAAGNPEAS